MPQRVALAPASLWRLTDEMLLICSSAEEGRLFEAATALAFFACLRAGEVALPNRDAPPKLRRDAVQVSPTKLRITVAHSKSSAFAPVKINLPRGNAEIEKLVQSLERYSAESRRGGEGAAFFRHTDGRPLTKFQLEVLFRRAATAAQIPPQVSPHSLRISGANYWASTGISFEDLKKVGRWRSSAYKRYLRPTTV